MTHAEIEAFLTVCEMKNITRAAEALYIGQSALSSRLKALEKETGCSLLVRGKGLRTVELTREGEEFYELALQYREIMSKMMEVGHRSQTGVLRVSTVNSLGTYLFPAVYENYLEKTGGMELVVQDMRFYEAADSVERGQTDLAFVTDDFGSSAVEIQPVFSEKMVLVCAADSAYREPVDISVLDVRNEVCCNWCEPFSQWHGETFGKKAVPTLFLEMMNQMELFLAKSGNWAVVPYTAALGFLGSGKIRLCKTQGTMPERTTYCLSRPGTRKMHEAAMFLDCLKEALQKADPEKINILL